MDVNPTFVFKVNRGICSKYGGKNGEKPQRNNLHIIHYNILLLCCDKKGIKW